MAAAFTIKIGEGAAELQKAIEATGPGLVLQAVAEDVTVAVQDHLRRLDSERPNQLGGKRTHFYAQAAAQTTHELGDNKITVSVTQQGIAQRFHGGTITPQSKQWITIPGRAEAHGRTAREFNNLRFIPTRRADTAMLVEADSTDVGFGRKRKDGTRAVKRGRERGGLVLYWLKKSVTQPADATVLPPPEKLAAVAMESARDVIAATLGRAGLGGAA